MSPRRAPVEERDFSPARRPPQFDRNEQMELTNIMKEIIFQERETESAKIELSLKSDFNILDAFRMIDFRNIGAFTPSDMIEYLDRHLGFTEFSTDDIFLFFKKVDKTGRQKINLSEFSNAYLPFSREYSSLVSDRPDYYSSRGADFSRFFNTDTRRDMKAVWTMIFKAERAMEAIRYRLSKRIYYNSRQAHDFCARNQAGIVTSHDLRELLSEMGFYSTDREIQGLLNRLDRDRDGVISIVDWMDEF